MHTVAMRKEASHTRSSRGFTLIELLIVVAILMMLVGILLPSLSKARDQGRRVRCGSNLRAFGQSLEYLRMQTGEYPDPKIPNRQYVLDSIGDIATEAVSGVLGDPRLMYCPTSMEDDPTAGEPFTKTHMCDSLGKPMPLWMTGNISYIYLGGIRHTYPDPQNNNMPTFDPAIESPNNSKRARNVLAGDRTVEILPSWQKNKGIRKSNHGRRGGWFYFTTGDAVWHPWHSLTRHPTEWVCDWYWPGPS